MTSSQLRNAFKVWLPTECAAFCAAPTEAPSWKAYLLVWRWFFVVGPELNEGKILILISRWLLFPSFQKYFLQNGRDQSWTPIRGTISDSSCPCHHPGASASGHWWCHQLEALCRWGGFWEVELPKRWRWRVPNLLECLKGPDNIHIYNYVYIYNIIYYIIIYIYCIYICWYINQGSAFFFWGGIISYVLERNDLWYSLHFHWKRLPFFEIWQLVFQNCQA